MSRGKIIFAAILASSALLVFLMIMDSDISRNLAVRDLPDIAVERVDFTRVINGREWRVKAADAESASGIINARSLDINIVEPATARTAQVYALRGEYSLASENMHLHDVDGVAWLGDRSVDFTAKRADYNSSGDAWYFSEGVSASDDRIFLTGQVGRIDSDGVFSLGEGARVQWSAE